MADNRNPPADRTPKQAREARLAEALRANLRRRKAAQEPKTGPDDGQSNAHAGKSDKNG